jgi:hypothetical protein
MRQRLAPNPATPPIKRKISEDSSPETSSHMSVNLPCGPKPMARISKRPRLTSSTGVPSPSQPVMLQFDEERLTSSAPICNRDQGDSEASQGGDFSDFWTSRHIVDL